jgi:hypothetical protein
MHEVFVLVVVFYNFVHPLAETKASDRISCMWELKKIHLIRTVPPQDDISVEKTWKP